MISVNPSNLKECFAQPWGFCCLALGIFQPWSYFRCRLVSDAEIGAILPSAQSYILVELTEALCALFIAAILALAKGGHGCKTPIASWPVMLLIGALPVVVGLIVPNDKAAYVSMVLFSACIHVWFYVVYVSVIYRFETKCVIVYILLSYALAALIEYPLELLPTVVSGVITIPCPMIAMLMCGKVARSPLPCADSVDSRRKSARASFSTYIPVIAVFGFTVGSCFVSAYSSPVGSFFTLAMYVIEFLLPLAFLVFLLGMYQRVSVVYLCQITFVVILAFIVLLTLAQGQFPAVASTASHLARIFVRMFFMVGIVVLLGQTNLRPLIAFCLTFALLYLSMAAGIAVNQVISYSDISPITLYLILVFVAVCVLFAATSVQINRGGEDLLFGVPDDHDDRAEHPLPSATTQRAIISKKCDELAAVYDLAPRECEVVMLIALGRSKPYIAKQLVISENTVRSHARQAYRKLGIHSKSELLDFFDS